MPLNRSRARLVVNLGRRLCSGNVYISSRAGSNQLSLSGCSLVQTLVALVALVTLVTLVTLVDLVSCLDHPRAVVV